MRRHVHGQSLLLLVMQHINNSWSTLKAVSCTCNIDTTWCARAIPKGRAIAFLTSTGALTCPPTASVVALLPVVGCGSLPSCLLHDTECVGFLYMYNYRGSSRLLQQVKVRVEFIGEARSTHRATSKLTVFICSLTVCSAAPAIMGSAVWVVLTVATAFLMTLYWTEHFDLGALEVLVALLTSEYSLYLCASRAGNATGQDIVYPDLLRLSMLQYLLWLSSAQSTSPLSG